MQLVLVNGYSNVEMAIMYTYRQNCSIHRVHLSVASIQVTHQQHVSDCQFCPFDWNDRQRWATPTDAQSLYLQPHFLTAFCVKISICWFRASKMQPTKTRKQFTMLIWLRWQNHFGFDLFWIEYVAEPISNSNSRMNLLICFYSNRWKLNIV